MADESITHKPLAASSEIAHDCVAVRVRMLNRGISKIYEDAMRPLGVTISQTNILVVIDQLGLARPSDICSMLHMDASTLSRNVDRMIEQGWCETVPEEDARAHRYRITADGRSLIKKSLPLWKSAQERVKEMIGPDGIDGLFTAAGRLTTP